MKHRREKRAFLSIALMAVLCIGAFAGANALVGGTSREPVNEQVNLVEFAADTDDLL